MRNGCATGVLWWSPWVVPPARRPVSVMDLLGALSMDLWKCKAGGEDQSPASVFCRLSMNNVRELIQGDKLLTNNTQGLFLAVVADPQSLLVPHFWRNFLEVWALKCLFLKRNKTVMLRLCLCESKGYPLHIIPHIHAHTVQHVAVRGRGPGRVGKGPLRVRGG